MRIVVLEDPHPCVEEPSFVKEAYLGIALDVHSVLISGKDDKYPDGAYMVSLEEMLRAIHKRNRRNWQAFQWLVSKWCEGRGRNPDVLIPLSFSACYEVQASRVV